MAVHKKIGLMIGFLIFQMRENELLAIKGLGESELVDLMKLVAKEEHPSFLRWVKCRVLERNQIPVSTAQEMEMHVSVSLCG